MLKSRNTMVTSAVLFLLVVILLRFAGGFFEDNVVRIVGAILGGNAEKIPILDFSSVNLSWMNPANWSMDEFASGINQWLHEMVDSILPAFIGTLNAGAVATTVSAITRTQLYSAATTVAKVAPAAL
ncbi:hypothetical protein [Evansella clarkii]|uniref:hypothetical protein n=1 Tax=Evansella clarkii TaxID=79879 RepID=UPI000997AC4E|nr:hypothetical protein [Evansella clarkii]